MLKIFILLVVFSTVLADKPPRNIDEAEEKCQRVYNVTNREMAELHIEYASETDKIDRKYKCFVNCIMDDLNIKDEYGKVDFKQAAIVYYPTDTHAQKVIAECETKHDSETDDCERQFKIVVCGALVLRN